MRSTIRIMILTGVVASLSWIGKEASATLEVQKTFKAAFPGKEKYPCTICHVAKLPKKDSHELNDYGKRVLDAAGGAGKKPTLETFQKVGEPEAQK